MINLGSQLFFKEEKMQSINSLRQFLKSMTIAKKVIKKHFNKNLAMSAKDEERFQLGKKCQICDKLLDVGDHKIRDYCYATGKYRGSALWSCNVNLKFNKKVPITFHNLRG